MRMKNGSPGIIAPAKLVDKAPGMIEYGNHIDLMLLAILIDGLLEIISLQPVNSEFDIWETVPKELQVMIQVPGRIEKVHSLPFAIVYEGGYVHRYLKGFCEFNQSG